jgi:hypothetical protein
MDMEGRDAQTCLACQQALIQQLGVVAMDAGQDARDPTEVAKQCLDPTDQRAIERSRGRA